MAEFDPVLTQQDFSRLSLQDMTPAERAELCRRYTLFVAHFGAVTRPPPQQRRIRKWVPGARTALDGGPE